MKKIRGYIYSREFMGDRVLQHIQNIVVRNYCNIHQFSYMLSSTEYAMQDCHLMLMQLVENIQNIDGVVAYSLFQLPQSTNVRNEVYKAILSQNKEMHFAVEGMQVFDEASMERVEILIRVKQVLNMAPNSSGGPS